MPLLTRAPSLIGLALAAMFTSGLGAGLLLQRHDAQEGFQQEASRIAEVLRIEPGDEVGDIRAGSGRWSVDLARRVGPEGHVFATAGPQPAHELMATVAASGLDNLTVITRTPGESPRLPLGCCRAILLRLVYSDLRRERPAFLSNLARVLRPGGLVAVIDVHPDSPAAPPRGTLSLPAVIQEFTGAGFTLEARYERWFGNTYCAVFRRGDAPGPVGQ
ncbi:MAG: hypothetical protein AB1635_01485 [Acidobacteriota bacterium]